MNSALTFGVELEFLLGTEYLDYDNDTPRTRRKYNRNKPVDPFPNDPRQVKGILDYPHQNYKPNQPFQTSHAFNADKKYASYTTCIADSLSKAGVPTNPFYKFEPHVLPDEAQRTSVIQTWEVKCDTSVFINWPESASEAYYKWVSVEVASPVFYSIPEAFEEIRKLCTHLKSTYRVMTNSTCGLHVHVGNGSAGFDLKILKKLMAALWTWEPQLQMLHPVERTSPKNGFIFSKPLRCRGGMPPCDPSRDNNRGTKPREIIKVSNHEALSMIFKTKTKEDLIYWLSHPETYNAYKMEHLLVGVGKYGVLQEVMGNSSKKTVEFRQHEGTLDATRIINWAELVIGFVDKARYVSTDQLDVENANPEDVWSHGFREMLRFFGGKDVEAFCVGWLMKNGEWLQEQLEKRQAAKTRDDEDTNKLRERQSEEAKGQIFKTAVAELRTMDRMLVQLEARQLAKMNRKLKKLDDTEFETRGRSRAPKACAATTDLRRGTAQSTR